MTIPKEKNRKAAMVGVLTAAAILLLSWAPVNAAVHVYTIEPVLRGATYTGGTGIYHGTPTIGYWWAPSGYYRYWLKYVIPNFAEDEVVASVKINIDVRSQYNKTANAGVYVYRVEDDSWTSSTIHSDWPITADLVRNRYASDSGGTPLGLISSDITAWLSVPGEGPGQMLSIALRHSGGGVRGCLLDSVPTLTIETTTPSRHDTKPWSRGHDILMERGLQIQAQIFPHLYPEGEAFDLDRWEESNFTTINTQWWRRYDANEVDQLEALFGPPPGRPWGRWESWSMVSEAEQPFYDNLVSLQFMDEWGDTGGNVDLLIQQAATILPKLRRHHPEVLSYTNQYGSQLTDERLRELMYRSEPDMLMQDTYVFESPGPSVNTLFYYLQRYRLFSLEGNASDPNFYGEQPIPHGMYLQTYRRNGYIPSDSEMRLNQFASWAFGCKFVSAFIYNSYNQNILSSLFDGFGDSNPRPEFYHMAAINAESLSLGDALVRLISTDVSMVTSGTRPSNVPAWSPAADPYITGISSAYPVLVGYFRPLHESFDGPDWSEQDYFMIVNTRTGPGKTGAETPATITLSFDFGASGITSLQRLSRATGEVEVAPLTQTGATTYQLALTLPGGTGDLFKFNTGAPFIDGPLFCGNPGTVYARADITGPAGTPDCRVDELDLAAMAGEWLQEAPEQIEYTVQPTLYGATYDTFSGIYHTTGTVGQWWSPNGTDYVYYAKYDIPETPGETIDTVLVNCDVTQQYNHPSDAGLYLRRVADDSWTENTVTTDWPDTGEIVVNRYASDTGATPFGLISSDITAWVSLPDEGPGAPLSIKFVRSGAGARGLLMATPTLTIITDPIHPVELAADLNGDGRVDLADFALFMMDWQANTDPAAGL